MHNRAWQGWPSKAKSLALFFLVPPELFTRWDRCVTAPAGVAWAGREMIKGPGWELCPTSSVAAVSVPVARQGHSLRVWFYCSPASPAGLCWACVCLVPCPPAYIPASCASPAVLPCVRLLPTPLVLPNPLVYRKLLVGRNRFILILEQIKRNVTCRQILYLVCMLNRIFFFWVIECSKIIISALLLVGCSLLAEGEAFGVHVCVIKG